MPLVSTAQTGFMFKFHPEIAKRWAHEYGISKNLPRHVRSGGMRGVLARHAAGRKRRKNTLRKVV